MKLKYEHKQFFSLRYEIHLLRLKFFSMKLEVLKNILTHWKLKTVRIIFEKKLLKMAIFDCLYPLQKT